VGIHFAISFAQFSTIATLSIRFDRCLVFFGVSQRGFEKGEPRDARMFGMNEEVFGRGDVAHW
jgi:hypothetical protein